MSGTNYGIWALHVSPGFYIGGPSCTHNISGLNSLRYLPVLAPEIMNSPSPR
jgi:hypothetical protein